jgi:hypothetical protein
LPSAIPPPEPYARPLVPCCTRGRVALLCVSPRWPVPCTRPPPCRGPCHQLVERDEALQALQMSVQSIILAPAGPPRQRTMLQLYRDERCASLPSFSLLERMCVPRFACGCCSMHTGLVLQRCDVCGCPSLRMGLALRGVRGSVCMECA